jgi:hypothetical protein
VVDGDVALEDVSVLRVVGLGGPRVGRVQLGGAGLHSTTPRLT